MWLLGTDEMIEWNIFSSFVVSSIFLNGKFMRDDALMVTVLEVWVSQLWEMHELMVNAIPIGYCNLCMPFISALIHVWIRKIVNAIILSSTQLSRVLQAILPSSMVYFRKTKKAFAKITKKSNWICQMNDVMLEQIMISNEIIKTRCAKYAKLPALIIFFTFYLCMNIQLDVDLVIVHNLGIWKFQTFQVSIFQKSVSSCVWNKSIFIEFDVQ